MDTPTEVSHADRFKALEKFVQDTWDLVTQCKINLNEFDLETAVGIHAALIAHNAAESRLSDLEAVYRRNLIYFNAFEREVENLFGMFFRREFLPTNEKVKGMSQAMFELAAEESFSEKYEFNRNDVKNVKDFYSELKNMISSKHEQFKGTYWDLKDCIKSLELSFTTHSTGIFKTSPEDTPSVKPTQMPRVRGPLLPEPVLVPPSLPPEFLKGFQG